MHYLAFKYVFYENIDYVSYQLFSFLMICSVDVQMIAVSLCKMSLHERSARNTAAHSALKSTTDSCLNIKEAPPLHNHHIIHTGPKKTLSLYDRSIFIWCNFTSHTEIKNICYCKKILYVKELSYWCNQIILHFLTLWISFQLFIMNFLQHFRYEVRPDMFRDQS